MMKSLLLRNHDLAMTTTSMLLGLLLGGCAAAPTGQIGPCPSAPVIAPISDQDMEWFEETATTVNAYGQQLAGFDEQAAQNCVEGAGLTWRVIARDGEYFMVTEDYSPQRINAVIEDAVVMEVSAG
jgi:hypothetical protein